MTQSIGDLGGSQLYTVRRIKHLLKRNIKVCVVAGSNDNFTLQKEFEGIDILIVPEINFLPSMFTKARWKSVVQKIVSFLQVNRYDVIESHSISTGVYAELVSKQTKSKNIIYLLNEDKVKNEDGINFNNFFNFKLKRNELFGVSSKSLEIILNRSLSEKENNFINIPFDLEEISGNESLSIIDEVTGNDADLKILSIARLDKTYLVNLIEEIIELAKERYDLKFLLVIIGNSSDARILESLKSRNPNLKNLAIFFPGYVHPIPSILFKKVDIFIGQGTASVNSISQRCATAIIDPRDNKSPGFLGVDTNNFGYPEKDVPNRSIKEILQQVILDKNIISIAQEFGEKLFYSSYLSSSVMKDFDDKIIKSDMEIKYWDFIFIKSKRRIIEFLLIYVFGIKSFEIIFNKIVKWKSIK
ncbi:glycosyltransferase family protein [Chryseobacterium chendengshani]|uniref:hypothetical protein n=1 Tax=Chryseobacterium sp. LJ756 TaxID=2864113 RepID=UPI001C642164|nr:hypothetical protein [Chryseobacterium sp. LJ756]MBW7676615.1 hypothetical protein [Chryseobacterium sp. LJ756]